MLSNRVRDLRVEAGWSQSDLARRVEVTRQSLHLVETMQVVPNTALAIKIARALGTTVENLFVDDEEPSTWVEAAGGEPLQIGDRVLLVGTVERLLARSAPSGMSALGLSTPAIGIVKSTNDAGKVCVEHAPQGTWQKSVVVAGCDIGLSLLANHAQRSQNGWRSVVWDSADNRQALRLLECGAAQMAALHYPTEAAPVVPSALCAFERVHFATWQLGWIVRRGNPTGFATAEALGSGRLRLANRPPGSGARALLDRLLAEHQTDVHGIPGYESALGGHLEVAMAVAAGLADVGVGIASAAAQVGADFLPIQDEVCELLVAQAALADDGVAAVLEVLAKDSFRWDLARYGPYEVAQTGSKLTFEAEAHR